ncbi:MAG: SH3 domain-containing protein [Candidatus Omnitrophota bacterium]|nr:SH3 domain-containing protein [Candidatus Omnitrophota bacterium]
MTKLEKNILCLLSLACAIFVNAYAADFPFIGNINADNINLRSQASTNSESLARLKKETKITVSGERFDWYKVYLPKTVLCFINRKYVKNGIVAAERVNLRSSPSQEADILGQASKGLEVEIIKTEPGWYGISAPQGHTFGWVHKKFVGYYSQVNPEPEKIEESAQNDKELKEGTPLASGILKPMGIFFKRRGSHKLIKDGKIIYYLKSEKKELLNNYSGYSVNVFGNILELPGQKISLIAVDRVEPVK